mmetsp:Transcript_10151/g.42117  ORF Transcript_10151/g.42117 Transcript_10151/m.42117 type:complete len:224 (+) Transcript_10151:418-1089(+)
MSSSLQPPPPARKSRLSGMPLGSTNAATSSILADCLYSVDSRTKRRGAASAADTFSSACSIPSATFCSESPFLWMTRLSLTNFRVTLSASAWPLSSSWICNAAARSSSLASSSPSSRATPAGLLSGPTATWLMWPMSSTWPFSVSLRDVSKMRTLVAPLNDEKNRGRNHAAPPTSGTLSKTMRLTLLRLMTASSSLSASCCAVSLRLPILLGDRSLSAASASV